MDKDKDLFDIGDNDIRVLGPADSKAENTTTERKWWIWLIVALVVLAAACIVWIATRPDTTPSSYAAAPNADTTQNVTYQTQPETKAYTKAYTDTINDITLRIYTPVGGHVELIVGQLPADDSSIILAARAADYRADNGQITGAFVYRGELIAKGRPKLGFCAIIGDELTMGMSQETALFERAVEQEGYFFRQYSLVHDGTFGEKLPKGKAIRRALCYHQESIAIVETIDYESLHDFAQALIDLGVQEAITLVGSVPLPLYVDENSQRHTQEFEHDENTQETYIVWRK